MRNLVVIDVSKMLYLTVVLYIVIYSKILHRFTGHS